MDDIKLRVASAYHSASIQNFAHHTTQCLKDYARVSLYGALALVTTIWSAVVLYNRFKSRNVPPRPRSPDLEKPQPVGIDSSKTKFAMEKPGGTTSPIHSSQTPKLTTCSLETLRLQATTCTSLPQLVPHRDQAPSIPSLPTEVLHHHGPPQHELGRVDRT